MSEEVKEYKLEIKFMGPSDKVDPEQPYVAYTFNIVFTDNLLMFHICHLYRNCLTLIDNGEMKHEEIPNYVNLNYVVKSVQEALDNRIKCLSSSYIDENYKWCFDRPEIFDKCLEYFSKLKKELKQLYNHKFIENDNLNKTERKQNCCKLQQDNNS